MNARSWVYKNVFIVQEKVTSLLAKVLFLFLSSTLLISCFGGGGGSSSSNNLKTDQLGITLSIISGDNQFAAPEQLFAMPLIVRVGDPTGSPIPGMEVTFTVTDPTAQVEVLSPKVTTDQNGIASSQVRAPNASNVRVSVEAKIVGSKNGVFFASLESRSFPETPTLALTDSVTGSDSFAVQTIVAADITNGGSVTKWCLSELQSARPDTGASICLGGSGSLGGWTDSKPNSFTLNNTNGMKTIYLWVADQFNQVSLNPVTDSIMFDNTPPGVPTLAVSDISSGSTTDTAQAFINVVISADGDATQWCVKSNLTSESLLANPSRTDPCWLTAEPTQHELSQLGVNRVYVWLMDQAGNTSATYDSKTINFAVNSMPDPVLTLIDPTTALSTYARQTGINIDISSDTFARKWCVSETQITRPLTGASACVGGLGPSNGWYTTEPTTFSLSSGDGDKTIYVWVANPFNDTNENAITRVINLDTTPPSIPIIDLKDPVTNQPNFTNQSSVLLQISGDNDAVAWCVFEGASNASPPSFPLFNNACWVGTRPSTAALNALGSRRVYLFTKDAAQNISPAPAVGAITYTTTPPSDPVLVLRDTTTNSTTLSMAPAISVSINSPSGTTRWCVSETQTSKPVNGTSNCSGGAGASSGWSTTAPTSFVLSSAQGAKTVYVWVADSANNVNANVSTASITLDNVAPPTPTLAMSDPNSGSQTNTNQLVAAIAVANDAQATKWCRIVKESSDAAPATPTLTEVCWTGTRPTTVFLEQPGNRKLYLYVRDAAGNVSAAASATIEYTNAVPADPTIVASHAVTGLTTYAKTTAVNINISGDADAVRWCVSETQTNRPSLGTIACSGGTGPSNGWFTAKPTTFTLSAAQGLKRIYVWTANAANNVNNNPSNAGITYDSVAPTTPTVALTDPNTNSTSNTNQSTVNLAITGDANAEAWCLIEQADAAANPAQPAYNNACFSTSKPLNATLTATGAREVFLYTRDAAYNVSASAGAQVISYSTATPATATLTLSDATTSSTSYIRQLAAQVSVTGDTGAMKWCLSQTQSTKPSLGTANCAGGTGLSNGWLTVRPTSFTVSATDASKNLYLWTADINNNVSATAASDSITLDTLPPSTPIVLLSDVSSGSTALTNQATVGISIAADTDAVSWCLLETSSGAAAPTAPLFNNACWVGTRPTTASLTTTGGRRVYVYTKDIAENVAPVPAVGMITYSTTPPADPTLTMRDQTTSSATHAIAASVNLSIGSPPGTLKWCVSESQNTKPASGTAACTGGAGGDNGWDTSLPTTLNLSAGQGAKTVYIWVSDSANNVNVNASYASITVDSAAPGAPTVVMSDSNTASTTETNQVLVNLAITNDAEAVRWCKVMQAAVDPDPALPTYGDQCWLSTEPTTHYMDATGSRKIFVYIRDTAGNISNAGTATIGYTTSTPSDPTLALADSVTGLTTYNKSSGLAVTIGSDATATRWCISETQSTRPLLGTSTCAGGSGASNGWHTARPTTWTVSAGGGQKRGEVW
ncbi:MAG: Ig-like domain-containing protein, partial [Pseudobdellovibrionaceae bacterium]